MSWLTPEVVGAWLVGGGVITAIVIPAIKHWLGKEYATKETLKEIKDSLEKNIVSLRTEFVRWVDRLERNSERINTLETKIELFWGMVEKNLATMLHRDDTPDIDVLLDKVRDDTINDAEREALVEALKDIENDGRRQNDRYAALMLRSMIEARLAEHKLETHS